MKRLKTVIFVLSAVFLWISPLCQTVAAADEIRVVFTYGSEKKKWINDVTDYFNKHGYETAEGKRIFVEAIPMGSGKAMQELLTGRRQAHLSSPASSAFITLANDEAEQKWGAPLIPETKDIVLSPVVIAMWKPMAEAIGWGKKPIGWAEILSVIHNPEGWGAYGYPEWGDFKFGHTHPFHSNSGLIALLAEAYAGAGKHRPLTLQDVESPDVRSYVQEIEKSILHYGSSTGFFGRKMFSRGPDYLSAAVMYENMVVESYRRKEKTAYPVVAIYPKEGTFWSNHPTGIVNGDWVTPEHKEAAGIYLDYLLKPGIQKKALNYGFRPALLDLPVTSPIDADHGVDPTEPKRLLPVPSAEVIRNVMAMWKVTKRHANVGLIIDVSGSMSGSKIENAKRAAVKFLTNLGDWDLFSLMSFNHKSQWLRRAVPLTSQPSRAYAERNIEKLNADGGTALYNAVKTGYKFMRENADPDLIPVLVVLSDGKDSDSEISLKQLLSFIQYDGEKNVIRVFPIGYGSGADKSVLEAIAEATEVKAYTGETGNINEIFGEISTYF